MAVSLCDSVASAVMLLLVDDEKINSQISFFFLYGYGALLGGFRTAGAPLIMIVKDLMATFNHLRAWVNCHSLSRLHNKIPVEQVNFKILYYHEIKHEEGPKKIS